MTHKQHINVNKHQTDYDDQQILTYILAYMLGKGAASAASHDGKDLFCVCSFVFTYAPQTLRIE